MQESADAGDEENGADEVALGEGVMLQTQVLGHDERHCHQPPQGREEVLWAEESKRAGTCMLGLPAPPSFPALLPEARAPPPVSEEPGGY